MKTKRPPRRRRRRKKRKSSSRTVYLGLGSNLGDCLARLQRAIREIGRIASLLRVSSFYRSDPVGSLNQPQFWNAAAKIGWRDSPEALLAQLQAIERRLGRVRRFPNGPREIDIDILDFAGAIRGAPPPVLPHPRMIGRRFALAPLAEIAPRWRHPVTGLTAREMLDALPARPGAWKVQRVHSVKSRRTAS